MTDCSAKSDETSLTVSELVSLSSLRSFYSFSAGRTTLSIDDTWDYDDRTPLLDKHGHLPSFQESVRYRPSRRVQRTPLITILTAICLLLLTSQAYLAVRISRHQSTNVEPLSAPALDDPAAKVRALAAEARDNSFAYQIPKPDPNWNLRQDWNIVNAQAAVNSSCLTWAGSKCILICSIV